MDCIAEVRCFKRDYAGAESMCADVIAMDKGGDSTAKFYGLLELGTAMLAQKKFAEAAKQYEAAVASDFKAGWKASAYLGLARAMIGMKKYDEALKWARKAAELESNIAKVGVQTAAWYQGFEGYATGLSGDHHKAQELIEKSLSALKKWRPPVPTWIVQILYYRGEDYLAQGLIEPARKCYQEALDLSKGQPLMLFDYRSDCEARLRELQSRK